MSEVFQAFSESGLPVITDALGFEPVEASESSEVAQEAPPEKALADLSDALRMGFDDESLAPFLSRAPGMVRSGSNPCPLPLRDFMAPRRESPTPGESRAPSIVVTRIGERVDKVTVECPCGERISLDCVY